MEWFSFTSCSAIFESLWSEGNSVELVTLCILQIGRLTPTVLKGETCDQWLVLAQRTNPGFSHEAPPFLPFSVWSLSQQLARHFVVRVEFIIRSRTHWWVNRSAIINYAVTHKKRVNQAKQNIGSH